MKETTNELASLISSLKLGSEEILIEKYMQLAGKDIVGAKCNIVELMDLACGREIHLGFDLNEEPMEGNDVNDQPTPIVKLPQARDYPLLLSNFVMEHHQRH